MSDGDTAIIKCLVECCCLCCCLICNECLKNSDEQVAPSRYQGSNQAGRSYPRYPSYRYPAQRPYNISTNVPNTTAPRTAPQYGPIENQPVFTNPPVFTHQPLPATAPPQAEIVITNELNKPVSPNDDLPPSYEEALSASRSNLASPPPTSPPPTSNMPSNLPNAPPPDLIVPK